MRDALQLLRLSAHLVAGKRYWLAPLLPLLWIAFQVFRLLVAWRPEDYTPTDAQGVLIGAPLAILGAALGLRVVAGDIDQRMLEVAYTVPRGAYRVWLAKIGASIVMLGVAELLLAVATFLFCTSYPPSALYGAFQAAIFYHLVAMAMAALFKSEATGALLTIVVAIFNGFMQGGNLRISPFFNPALLQDSARADVLAWTVQNRIGMLLFLAATVLLTFRRAERREKMLGG